MELEPTQMDKVFEYLEANGIDVLQMNDDSNVDDDDLEIMLSDEDEWIWRRSTCLFRTESASKIRSVCI